MMKKFFFMAIISAFIISFTTACKTDEALDCEIQVFAASSLGPVITELADIFNTKHPEVKIIINADSSGTLATQIQEGFDCDVFFSAAQEQMDILDRAGMIIENTRSDVVKNQVVLITYKDSDTKVTSLLDINNATSFALADESVPVGKYTKAALMSLGIKEINPEISEQASAAKVLMAVTEKSCEIGTVYYSDIYGHEDDVEVLERVDIELTGDIVYPVAQVNNSEATEDEIKAAREFVEFVSSDEAKDIFNKYLFETNVK